MIKNNVDAVLLSSGGLDSTTLAYWLQKQGISFVPLFINYGQHCVDTEYQTLKEVIPSAFRESIHTIDISQIYQGSKSKIIIEPNLWTDNMVGDPLYLPYRNLLMLSTGAAFAQAYGYNRLFAGFINSNHAKEIDCSARFFVELGKMLSEYGSVRIEMPFRDMSKYEVACIGIDLNVPLGNTFSCQAASVVPCGACPNCVDRLEAFKQLENVNS